MTDKDESTQQPEVTAEQIAAEVKDVRARTRTLVVDLVRHGTEPISRLPETAGRILDGAIKGVANVAEEKKADVLGEVIDGLADGFTRGANAMRFTFEEAKSRGQAYTQDEIKTAMEDLQTLESMFVERVEQLVKSGLITSADQSRDLLEHAKRAAGGMRPEIESAIKAARNHPINLVKESASVATGVSRRAVGSLLQAIGGVLDGAGEVIGGHEREQPDDE